MFSMTLLDIHPCSGPKYHNLMEERLLQSRLNHLENQLRRTTLVTQRQQLHIQKTLNNIPKPSKNLDRRVAEAFRWDKWIKDIQSF